MKAETGGEPRGQIGFGIRYSPCRYTFVAGGASWHVHFVVGDDGPTLWHTYVLSYRLALALQDEHRQGA